MTNASNLIISAPLGDFRHMAHIGRDGTDFGKEHLFTHSSKGSKKHPMQPAPHHLHMTGANGSIHNESPIIKSSVPISKAIEMVRQQRNTINNKMQGIHGITGIANTNCTSSINTSDSLSDLEILQQNSGDHVYGQYRYQYSSNDADEDDEDISSHGSCGKKGGNGDGDDCSLLADVLAVMSLPKYSNLPGNPTGFKSGESTTSCSKLGGGFKHSDDDFHSYSSKNNDSEYETTLSSQGGNLNYQQQRNKSRNPQKRETAPSTTTTIVNTRNTSTNRYSVLGDDEKHVEQEFQEVFTLEETVNSPNFSSNLPKAEIVSSVTPTTKPMCLTLEPESEEDEIAL